MLIILALIAGFIGGVFTMVLVLPSPSEEIEEAEDRGYDNGYAQGVSVGKHAADRQLASTQSQLGEAWQELDRLRGLV